jgi:NTP pyrophosphatase (non-canonical NTP hydrolase)
MDNTTYQAAVLETLAGSDTYENYIDRTQFDRDCFGFVACAARLENYKKTLAYGKNLPKFETINPIQTNNVDVLHAKLGIAGEAGEVFDAESTEEVKKEVGDLLWYVSVLLSAHGLTFADTMQGNIDKLRVRYPTGKFTREEALNRRDMAKNG